MRRMQIIPITIRCRWKYLSMLSFFKYSCCLYDKLTDCFFCQNLIVTTSSFIESVLPLLKMVGSQLTHLRWLFYFSKSIKVSNDITPPTCSYWPAQCTALKTWSSLTWLTLVGCVPSWSHSSCPTYSPTAGAFKSISWSNDSEPFWSIFNLSLVK